MTKLVRTVAQLRELVGQELGVSPWIEITQELVNAFADLTGDDQYIHVDPQRAAATMFGGTVAHGYLTLSLVPALARQREGVRLALGERMTVNYGLNRVRFPGPVRVGARIRLCTTLLNVEEVEPGADPDGRPRAVQLTYLQTIEVEGAERPGLVAECLTRLYF
ncbi:MAG: enoyl-CoA hydratase [Chloroflexota bacterium]